MKKTYKYRLYPNQGNVLRLEQTLETCRHIYNTALEQRVMLYRDRKKRISCYEQINQVKEAVPNDEYLVEVHSQVRQDVICRLDKAYSAFFRRCGTKDKPGFPRFKGRDRYHSFTYPQSGFEIKPGVGKHAKLKLSKIGSVEVRHHREIPDNARVKTCTIVRKNGKWYACFSVVLPDTEPLAEIGNPVGIDVGLETYATISDGAEVDNLRFFRKAGERLANTQRKSKRMQKGSVNRDRQMKKVAICHEKIANQRKNHLHQVSRYLVNTYPFIRVEHLRIGNMVRNHNLSKSILDAGWGMFFEQLAYKAEEAGTRIEFVNPAGTSQTCLCGEPVPKKLKDRIHVCPKCGLVMKRDLVSSKLIGNRVGTTRIQACGERGDPALAGVTRSAKQEAPSLIEG